MNETNEGQDDVSRGLGRLRLAPPSSGLRQRVVGAALDAWAGAEHQPDRVPWTPPVLRFAAAAAAAVVLVHLANVGGDRALASWQAQARSFGQTSADDVSATVAALDGRSVLARLAQGIAARLDTDAAVAVGDYHRRLVDL
jgi:hypothetical protein